MLRVKAHTHTQSKGTMSKPGDALDVLQSFCAAAVQTEGTVAAYQPIPPSCPSGKPIGHQQGGCHATVVNQVLQLGVFFF